MHNSKYLLSILVLVFGLTLFAEVRGKDSINEIPPLIVVQVLTDLKEAIKNNNYVFIRQQTIDNRLTKSGKENGQVILVYFCNFGMLNRALKWDRRVGVFLPCKITLIQKSNFIVLAAVNPKMISLALDQNELDDLCDKLTRDYSLILDEATL